jgi:hypothetical protein
MSAEAEVSHESPDEHEDPGPAQAAGNDGEAVSEPESVDEEPVQKKRRGPNVERQFKEVNRWLKEEFGADQLKELVNAELNDLARQGGGFQGLRRQNRVTKSSEWQGWCYRRQWTTCNGFTVHTSLNCPFLKQTGCKCQVNVVYSPTMVSVSVSDLHSADDHADDKSKLQYLKPQQMKFIQDAVKIAPHQSASALIRNVQGSLSKQLAADLKSSVERAIRKERAKIGYVAPKFWFLVY